MLVVLMCMEPMKLSLTDFSLNLFFFPLPCFWFFLLELKNPTQNQLLMGGKAQDLIYYYAWLRIPDVGIYILQLAPLGPTTHRPAHESVLGGMEHVRPIRYMYIYLRSATACRAQHVV